jgi:hypothetical protein
MSYLSDYLVHNRTQNKTFIIQIQSHINCDLMGPKVKIKNNLDTQCTICYGEINKGDQIREISCGHLFHSSCLDEWIQTKGITTLCPFCQTKLFIPKKSEKTLLKKKSENIVIELDSLLIQNK